jgi:hypothetical protein
MLDEAGRACPGIELASIRVGGPMAASRTKSGIAHERLSDQNDQFVAIDGIHSADDTARTEEEQWRLSNIQPGSWQPAPEASSRPTDARRRHPAVPAS